MKLALKRAEPVRAKTLEFGVEVAVFSVDECILDPKTPTSELAVLITLEDQDSPDQTIGDGVFQLLYFADWIRPAVEWAISDIRKDQYHLITSIPSISASHSKVNAVPVFPRSYQHECKLTDHLKVPITEWIRQHES